MRGGQGRESRKKRWVWFQTVCLSLSLSFISNFFFLTCPEDAIDEREGGPPDRRRRRRRSRGAARRAAPERREEATMSRSERSCEEEFFWGVQVVGVLFFSANFNTSVARSTFSTCWRGRKSEKKCITGSKKRRVLIAFVFSSSPPPMPAERLLLLLLPLLFPAVPVAAPPRPETRRVSDEASRSMPSVSLWIRIPDWRGKRRRGFFSPRE